MAEGACGCGVVAAIGPLRAFDLGAMTGRSRPVAVLGFAGLETR